jgi:carbon-monoxide dehydrogenase medium subunit
MRVQGPSGERWIGAEQFFEGMFTTALRPGELLLEVVFPAPQPRTGWSFLEASRRQGDYAMMGLAAGVRLDPEGVCEQAWLVYLNAGDRPVQAQRAAQALEGQPVGAEAFGQAAAGIQEEIDPLGNVHASAEYQRHLATVLTRKSLAIAADRARRNGKPGPAGAN